MMKQFNHGIKRRTLLEGFALLGLTTRCQSAFAVIRDNAFQASSAIKLALNDYQIFRSTCSMECLHCNLTAYVHNGEVKKIQATNNFNVKGCLRGISRTKWITHKERLTTPLLRVGEKGKGEFKPISWNEALDLIEQKIKGTIEHSGNEGMFLTTGSGNMDAIKNPMGQAFFDYLGGATRHSGALCCAQVTAAMMPMVGLRYADTRDTIAESKYLICWGNNPAVTMQGYFKEYTLAKKKGARLIVIDPRFSETAAKADEWVPIIPGTDVALALGMIRIIIEEKLYDEDFLRSHTGAVYLVDDNHNLLRENDDDQDSYLVYDTLSKRLVRHDSIDIVPALTRAELTSEFAYTTVFEKIREQAEPWSLDEVEQETKVPPSTVERIARDYASIKPAMIIQNMSGAIRTEFGTYTAASQFYLALLTGNIGQAGNGVCDAGGVTQMLKINPPIPSAPNVKAIAPIPIANIGDSIMNDRPHPIKFWWIMTLSVATQLPNTNRVKAALKKVPFVVVADNLMTSTALYADLILPVTTIFEDTSLTAGIRSHYIQLMEKAVEPIGEAKPDYWIFARLAERFGFGEIFNQPIERYINACLDGTGITIDQLRQSPIKPAEVPWIPFKDGVFRTSTKKAHFFVEDWKNKNFSPLVTYKRVNESPKGSPELAAKYPLMAIQRKLARSIHSSHGTNEWILEIQRGQPNVLLHPFDAQERQINHGEWVKVFNHRGEHRAVAIVTQKITQGVVCLDNGWWEQQGGSSSHLTNDQIDILSNGHCCNSTLVNVSKDA